MPIRRLKIFERCPEWSTISPMPCQTRAGDALDDRVVDLVVRRVAPPEQHVGLVELLLGQAVLGILQRHRRGDDIAVFAEQRRDLPVHALGIVLGNGLVLLFVDVFAPDGGTDSHGRFLRWPGT